MTLWEHTRAGALGGLAAGALGWALELLELPAGERTAALVAALCGVLLPACVVAGVALALAAWAITWLARRIARERWPAGSVALLSMALALPGLLLLVDRLASGRQAARLLGGGGRKALLVVTLSLLLAAGVWALVRAGRWLVRPGRRTPRLIAGIALLGLAVALYYADARLYRRLYGYLHLLLAVGHLAAGLLGVLTLWGALGPERSSAVGTGRRRAGWAMALTIAALAGGWQARRALGADPHLRFGALELTTLSAKVLAAIPLPSGSKGPAFLDIAPAAPTPGRSGSDRRYRIAGANVVLVTIDALRPDHLGAYGYKRPTSPNIDSLAGRSVRFRSAYCQAPLTCYSVPSLHTGDYLRSTLPLLPAPPMTLAQMLSPRGYRTAAFFNESIFFCDDPRATGYGGRRFGFAYAETELRSAAPLTDRVVRYLHRADVDRGRKHFIWVHYFDVHEPYGRHPRWDYGGREVDRYDSEINNVDEGVGRLVGALSQLRRPTILIVTSDHGEEFREHGGSYHGSSLYEEQIRVPLLIAAPGIAPRVVDRPVQLVDVVPTVLSLLGHPVPASVRGRSLVGLLLGEDERDRAAFSEVHTKKMVRVGGWKLIHDFRKGTYELYDLANDPRERSNAISRRPRRAAQLTARLHRWFDRLRAVGAHEVGRPEAIDLGRIGDRRAVPALGKLVADSQAAPRWRREAAKLLGQLHDARAKQSLWIAAAADDSEVAYEAAIALGELQDPRARQLLLRPVSSTDNDLRFRAAVALGRVDGPQATPALIEALYSGKWELQNRAAHYLGQIGDVSAVEPLIKISQLVHLRARAAVALGRLGRRHPDPRIVPFLLGLVQSDYHPDVRQRSIAALSFAGDARAVAPLVKLLLSEPDLTWVPEALTRLGAIGSARVPGLDLAPAAAGRGAGWGQCHERRSESVEDYPGSTWCEMVAPAGTLTIRLRVPLLADLMVRVRPLSKTLVGQQLTIEIEGRALPPHRLARGWQTLRIRTDASHWRAGGNRLLLRVPPLAATEGQALLGVDFVLLAQRKAEAR